MHACNFFSVCNLLFPCVCVRVCVRVLIFDTSLIQRKEKEKKELD